MKLKEPKNFLKGFEFERGVDDSVVLDSYGNTVDSVTYINGYLIIGKSEIVNNSKDGKWQKF